MLYTASYFEPRYHQGRLLSISRSSPQGFKVSGKLKFLIPSAELLSDWKTKKIDEIEYTQRYRAQIKQSWGEVKAWLNSLDPKQDLTLLCWEVKGTFCHRNLVALLVQKHRTDCYGGRDVVAVDVERCGQCGTKMIPGLDASYCPSCLLWVERWKLESQR